MIKTMIRASLLVALTFRMLAANAAQEGPAYVTPQYKEAPRTTIQLFNGRDLAGWMPYLSDPSVDQAKAWWVKDGILHTSGNPAGYLRTQVAYADYALHVEWRWPTKDPKANSGVLFHIVNADTIWPKGFEANLLVGRLGDVNMFDDARANGEILGRPTGRFSTGRIQRPAAQSPEKPLGEWNAMDLIAAGDSITVTVNGVQANHLTGVMPNAGSIALQSEGAPVEFRNVRLTPLPPAVDLHAPVAAAATAASMPPTPTPAR